MVSISAFCGLHAASALSAEKVWRVNQEHARCFLNSLADYQNSVDNPITIYLKVCPIVDRRAALRALQVATSIQPSVSVLATDVDEKLLYTHEDLSCLSGFEIDPGEPLVELPRAPCAQ
jgi:hypothetical protein|tara:strand:- start:3661 stop:4017 length:357 start_codon:yes stop_codon:yes gene_type:complete